MKYLYKILFALLLSVSLISCEEEDPITSKTTFFPTIEIQDGSYVIWERGTSFVDPGVIALENGAEINVTTLGEVDADTVGVYKLTYSATNADGFPASSDRFVLVVDDPDAILSIDISGTYARDSDTDQLSTVTSLGNGFFEISDALPPNGIRAIAGVISSSELIITKQSSQFGDITADSINDPDTSITYDATSISVNLRVGPFGVIPRTLIKN